MEDRTGVLLTRSGGNPCAGRYESAIGVEGSVGGSPRFRDDAPG